MSNSSLKHELFRELGWRTPPVRPRKPAAFCAAHLHQTDASINNDHFHCAKIRLIIHSTLFDAEY